MAYDAPGGGTGRYARPEVRSGTRYVSMRGLLGSRRVPMMRPGAVTGATHALRCLAGTRYVSMRGLI
eukprot:3625239-Prymnesium_polylepis.1